MFFVFRTRIFGALLDPLTLSITWEPHSKLGGKLRFQRYVTVSLQSNCKAECLSQSHYHFPGLISFLGSWGINRSQMLVLTMAHAAGIWGGGTILPLSCVHKGCYPVFHILNFKALHTLWARALGYVGVVLDSPCFLWAAVNSEIGTGSFVWSHSHRWLGSAMFPWLWLERRAGFAWEQDEVALASLVQISTSLGMVLFSPSQRPLLPQLQESQLCSMWFCSSSPKSKVQAITPQGLGFETQRYSSSFHCDIPSLRQVPPGPVVWMRGTKRGA